MAIQPRGNEQPYLIKNDWGGDKNPGIQADFHVQIEGIGGTGIRQMWIEIMIFQRLSQGCLHLLENVASQLPAPKEAHHNRNQ